MFVHACAGRYVVPIGFHKIVLVGASSISPHGELLDEFDYGACPSYTSDVHAKLFSALH